MEIDLSKKKLRYFKMAKEVSKFGKDKDHKLGCILVHKGKVISKGYNSYKTSSAVYNPFKTLHAETHALLQVKGDISGAVLYIHREIACGQLALSKPCYFCHKMIKERGIKKVYYTDNQKYNFYKVV